MNKLIETLYWSWFLTLMAFGVLLVWLGPLALLVTIINLVLNFNDLSAGLAVLFAMALTVVCTKVGNYVFERGDAAFEHHP